MRVSSLVCGLLLASVMALADSPDVLTPGISDTYLIPQGVQRFELRIDTPGRLRLEGRAWETSARDQIRLWARLLDAAGREVASASQHHYGPFELRTRVTPGRYVVEVEGHNFGTRGKVEMSRYSIWTSLAPDASPADD